MNRRRNQKRESNPPKEMGLPNDVAAAWFVCQCFGVGVKDLNAAMTLLRKTDRKAAEHYPPMIHGETIARAKVGSGPWSDVMAAVCHRALMNRIRWREDEPQFASSATTGDELVFTILRLYDRLVTQLKTHGISGVEVLWCMVEHVFLPTAFIHLHRKWRNGLGS
jgi:hypothetical protein